jgi:ATP-dependent DNA helicase RecG
MNFSTPIENLKYVGSFYEKKLHKLKIRTLGDLLFYFPERYEDFSLIRKIDEVKINENVCVQGVVMDIGQERSFQKKMTIVKALLQDDSSNIELVWFNQPFINKNLKKGDHIIVSGKVVLSRNNLYLSPTTWEKITEDMKHLGRVMPIYKETKGLSSKYLRFLIKPLIDAFKDKLPETLPDEVIKENDLLDFQTAFEQIHFPTSLKMAEKAKYRFAFEKLFYLSLFSLKKRSEIETEKAQKLEIKKDHIERVKKSLAFTLTNAQEKTIKQILKDLNIAHPMNRLVQGDVGSGKTVVAAIAALNCIKNKSQVVLMAPTEILAKQHFKTIFDILKNFNVNVGLLTGKEDKFYSYKLKNDTIEISREKLLKKCENGDIDFLVGTQALIAKTNKKTKTKVKFKNLALVVVDEQHRFGVKQRAELCKENNAKIPHLLSMTATPIPRSLALTIWGDLDLSIIDELPKGRKKIETEIVKNRKKTYEFIEKELKKGRQAFVICPRIEESERESLEIELKNVIQEYENLKDIFPKFKIEMLHGKMKPKEKEEIMKNFKKKKFDILVSTSVIEVGIDVPNATVMLIEGSDRFGLAQLHQFRGRVGRSSHQSYCFLATESSTQKTYARIKAMEKYDSGFKLSEIDLKLRGPGEFFGVKQWGLPDYVMTALKDIKIVEKARESAKGMLPLINKNLVLKTRLKSFEENTHIE